MILDRLVWSDSFERFVSTKYPSEKRFGLEGGESLIPGMKAMVRIVSGEEGGGWRKQSRNKSIDKLLTKHVSLLD